LLECIIIKAYRYPVLFTGVYASSTVYIRMAHIKFH
jgi:hypothetical protein